MKGSPTVWPLPRSSSRRAALKDNDAYVRAGATDALGRSADPRAREPFIAALKDSNVYVRSIAANALWRRDDPRGLESMITDLGDRNSHFRLNAAAVLAEIKDARAINALQGALTERNMAAIAGAHSFFIKAGKSGSEDTLIEALKEFGDISMAQDFLNCGNSRLADAARSWARQNGYVITSVDSVGGDTWGGAR